MKFWRISRRPELVFSDTQETSFLPTSQEITLENLSLPFQSCEVNFLRRSRMIEEEL